MLISDNRQYLRYSDKTQVETAGISNCKMSTTMVFLFPQRQSSLKYNDLPWLKGEIMVIELPQKHMRVRNYQHACDPDGRYQT